MKGPTVCILLAAYNGKPYIRQMIDSVLTQDYPHIQLVLSDDGSEDGTLSVLEDYAARYSEQITLYRSGARFGSAKKHFMHLLSQFHDAPYIMFCDQDDVWRKDKVGKTLAKMQELESTDRIPAMVHTDLQVVDQELKEISPSFFAYSRLDGTRLRLNQLVVQNVVTGCTMMINRPLAVLACGNIPEDGMLMHDWWIAMLASACGKTGLLGEATIAYRQHGDNSVGAKNVRSAAYLWKRLTSSKMRQSLDAAAYQAQVFLDCYFDLLQDGDRQLLNAFASTQNKSLVARDIIYLKYRLIKNGWIRIGAQFLGL